MPPPLDEMNEKCIRNLPPVRVSDSLERALMRLAARDDRSLSEYIRMVLTRHAFGHGSTVPADERGVE